MQEYSLDSHMAPTVFACMPSNRIGRIEKNSPNRGKTTSSFLKILQGSDC